MTRFLSTAWRKTHGPRLDRRTIAIGDVHGQARLLSALLDYIEADLADVRNTDLIFTGDLIDRGPSSLQCLDLAMEAERRFRTRWLLPGNHEIMLLAALSDPDLDLPYWHMHGGRTMMSEIAPGHAATLSQWAQIVESAIPAETLELLRTGPTYIERGGFVFVHGGLHPKIRRAEFLAVDRMDRRSLSRHWAWIKGDFTTWREGWDPQRHDIVVHGHTPPTGSAIRSSTGLGLFFDKSIEARRINIDATMAALPQICAVDIREDQFRLLLAQAEKALTQ